VTALPKLNKSEQRVLMREKPEEVLFPVNRMFIDFGFPPEALRQELEAGRLTAVLAGMEKTPCISWASLRDWMTSADSPGVLVNHVKVYLDQKRKGAC
jgi:hypothetical protein